MDFGDRKKNLWSLSYDKLAEQCHVIADDTSGTIDPQQHFEAKILSAAWKDALALPEHNPNFEEAASRKVSMLQGLRERTIEVVVKIGDKLPHEDE